MGVLFSFEDKGWSCSMCKSVRQKCGHTTYYSETERWREECEEDDFVVDPELEVACHDD